MARFDVRTRLTLWHIGTLAAVLLAFSLVIHFWHGRDLARRMDGDLLFVSAASVVTLQHEAEEAAALGKTIIEMEPDFLSEHLIQFRPAILVADGQGTILVDKPVSGNPRATIPRGVPVAARTTDQNPHTIDDFRVVCRRIDVGPPNQTFFLAVGDPVASIQAEMAFLRRSLLISCPVAVAFIGLLGWFLVGKTLAPVKLMAEQARAIGEESLGQRLAVENPHDELGYLAQTFNQMLGRVQAAFERQRQFMVDASHELRTPLTVIRTTTEVTLSDDARHETEYREALRITDEQVRRLSRIVEDMFLLTRGDAGQRVARFEALYLDETVAEAVRAIRVLAEEKEIAVTFEPMPEMPFQGDESLLRQLFLNLLDNAVKFSPSGGEVRVQGRIEAQSLVFTVTDNGPGIPEIITPYIFDRFVRGDSARTNQRSLVGGGAGLGLSIARRIAELHNGKLKLVETGPEGSAFSVHLPSIPAKQ
jgi:heavy metal sensor kinase